MTTLSDVALKIRSKNAGPFWLTIDIFCETEKAFQQACQIADNDRVASALGTTAADLKRYEIASLNVLKFSLPRPEIQGTRYDRDMHGASFANLLSGLSME
ncbi:DUF4387 family protein [Actibacterium pelagium]|uniref:DUF4387 domain-containing protein n=1 Tax=Actibacterium pelagium TaxID=2029103 RepID=A0A917AIX6_9RHOB|nr:DUF4387 family protein [Actibacterium pelagium]GGE54386.1 hypothetical protein GCM10011517_22490 [Actibacterium pelagium]